MTKYIIEGKMLQNSIFHLEGEKKSTLYTQTFLEIYTIKFNNGYLCLGGSRKGLLLKNFYFQKFKLLFYQDMHYFPN